VSNRLLCASLACLLIAVASAPTLATVSLTLSDGDATPTYARIGAGGSVVLTVRLNATSEQTTGLDYFLRASGAGSSGLFSIGGRSLAGSAYPVPYFDDATVTVPADALLDPDNNVDLGGSVPNVNVPVNAGNHLVANLTLNVSPSAPDGVYTIETFSMPGTGWIGAGPSFPEAPFNSHATFTLEVPEPTSLGLLALAASTLIRRRQLH
jgi:hypothetical protein